MSAKQKAVEYLGRFARTELQIRRYLKRKEFSEPEINEAIEYLRSHQFLNDDAYARSFIESKIRNCDGPLKIKQMLFSKGISPATSDRLLRELYPVELQIEAAQTLIERKMPNVMRTPRPQSNERFIFRAGETPASHKKTTASQRERVMRFVASRGFPRYVIIQAFKPRSS